MNCGSSCGCLLALGNRFVKAAGEEENLAYIGVDNDGERIELERAADFGDAFVRALHGHEVIGVPMMGGGVVGVELDGAAKFLFGRSGIPVIKQHHEGERGVGFGERIVKLESLERGGFCQGIDLVGGQDVVGAEQNVGIREANVGGRIVGIFFNGLLEAFDSLPEIVLGALVPVVATLQESVS